MNSFQEFMAAQQPEQQPEQPVAPQAMNQTITTKVDQLLTMIGAKNPMQIQAIRDELNRRLQELQAEKGYGQRAANLSYRNAALARKDA